MDFMEYLLAKSKTIFNKVGGFTAASVSYRNQHRKVIESNEEATENEVEFVRARARHLFWNNGLANNAVLSFVANLGYIEVNFVDENGKKDLFWQEGWEEFVKNCSYDGYGNFNTIQAICAGTLACEGEVFLRRVVNFEASNFIPFKLEFITADNIPINFTNLYDGIINGIKFVKNKPASYLVKPYKRDLEAVMEAATDYPYGYFDVPADKIIHIWRKIFPDQKRGLPFLTPVISTLWNHQDLEDSVTRQAVNFASFAYFVKNSETAGKFRQDPLTTVKQGTKDSGKTPSETVNFYETDAGQFLHGDVDIKVLQSAAIKTGINDFLSRMQQIVSVALASTSFQVDGDCTKYNYSAMRAALVSIEGQLSVLRYTIITPILIDKVVDWWLAAVSSRLNSKKKRPKVILRYPKTIVPNFLELMRAYEIALKNNIIPVDKIFDELDINPEEFNSSFQTLWTELQKKQAEIQNTQQNVNTAS